MSETTTPASERRTTRGGDRRKNPRSGRRASDPRVNWRRVAWLFGGYALYVSARSLPSRVKQMLVSSTVERNS